MGVTGEESSSKVEELRVRLEEAEETLRAIRGGEVDALVVSGPDGEQVFTLQGAEHPYRALVEAMSEGALTLSPDGHILYCNRTLGTMLKTPLQELIGSPFARFVSSEDESLFEMLIERGLSGSGKVELTLIGTDGTRVPAYLSIYPLQLSDMWAACLVVTDLSEPKRLEAERTAQLAETNSVLQAEIKERRRIELARQRLLHQLVTTQEEERRRISRDLHDQFGQQLTALRFNLDRLKELCGEEEEVCQQVERAQLIAKQLDAEMDFLAWELRPADLDALGLAAALANYTSEWSEHSGIPAEFHSTGMESRLPQEIETNLYRIAQEALNNIIKYAQASCVNVLLEHRDGHAALIVEDDGSGFDSERLLSGDGDGLGLIGMRERASSVGGTFEIESKPDEGTTIYVRIPD